MMLSPLLELLELDAPPYKTRSEKFVQIELDDPDEDENMILEGYIDAIVVQEKFWLFVIESKRYGFNTSLAVPQLLAYMSTQPSPNSVLYGMAMNGEDYIFVKLDTLVHQYELSDKLTLSRRGENPLYEIVQVMKLLISKK
jgi:hypothetical protein